jgi:hypothetical protein
MIYRASWLESKSGVAMTDQLSSDTVLRVFLRTLLLTFFAVVGLTISLCGTPSCECRVFGAWVGMASGATLFIQIVCAQIERHYRGGFDHRASFSA